MRLWSIAQTCLLCEFRYRKFVIDSLTKHSTKDAESDESDSLEAADSSCEQIGHGILKTAPIAINRDEYLQAYRDLSFDRYQLQLKNNLLHRRLAEYYKKRKLDHVLKPLEGAVDLEEKYQQTLFSYEELKEKEEREMLDIKSKLQAVQVQYGDKLEHAEKSFNTLQHLEKSTGTGLIYSKKGKPIAEKTVERFLTLQRRKRLYVAQYEQLHIDHQNFMTKIEEREDELIKNRAKCTEHNQMLAHIREKMHHTDELERIWGKLRVAATNCAGRCKGERMKAGLLTRKDLLRDYQNATDEVGKLRERKDELQNQVKEITRQVRAARKRMLIHHTASEHTDHKETAVDTTN
ncbi:unnamed protein product [Colias eurytheme]|nr:unnamed protein product [Colias eurytheme]